MSKLYKEITNIEDIKLLEKVSAKNSDSYIPISTYSFLTKMTNFEFLYARRYRNGSNSHYAVMGIPGSDVYVYIENSFDRTLSLRIRFKYNNFVFGNIKQIHKGESASHMTESFDNINTWYRNAVQSINTMKIIPLNKSEMIDIATEAFKLKGIDFKNIVNFNYEHKSTLDFVNYLINGFIEGEFIKRSARGTKVVKGTKNQTLIVKISKEIWDYLAVHYPELFL